MIDLRSDTVTRPSEGMLEAMFNAKVGDDVFGEDASINELEQKAAEMFGTEAGLFCPSGTMTNQIAIKVHTQPGDEILCHEYSHIYNYEGGGIAFNSACQVRLLKGNKGLISPKDIEPNINSLNDLHAARTRLISLENTSNKGGGSCYDIATMREIGDIAKKHKLAYHMDGARLFNSLVALKQDPQDYGQIFDSVSICLSKGLGCPVGSLLLGNKNFIHESRRIRKKMGGGMRQGGYLAAAGIYALNNNISRLSEDHEKAILLKKALQESPKISSIEDVETNIVIFSLKPEYDQNQFVSELKEKGILMSSMGPGKLRFVTHMDVSMENIEKVCSVLGDS